MIEINGMYYAKSTIKKISPIIRVREREINIYQFIVCINLGDGRIREESIETENDSSDSLVEITYIFNTLYRNLK